MHLKLLKVSLPTRKTRELLGISLGFLLGEAERLDGLFVIPAKKAKRLLTFGSKACEKSSPSILAYRSDFPVSVA